MEKPSNSAPKIRSIDRATAETTELLLPRSPLLSSIKSGWDDRVFLEYHWQPSGEHEEVCAAGNTIAIFTKVGEISAAKRSIDGRLYEHSVKEGDVLIVPADVGVKARWQGDSEFILIGLKPHIFNYALENSSKVENLHLIPQIPIADPLIVQIGIALQKMLASDNYNRLYVETMANTLAVHLMQYYSSKKIEPKEYRGGLPRGKLKIIIEYINANLDRDLKLQELAELAQMSPRYFAELFKVSTGLTPHQYLISVRVDRAKQLLVCGKHSIAEIALNVGFANQSHLNLHFKRLMGITPKQFDRFN